MYWRTSSGWKLVLRNRNSRLLIRMTPGKKDIEWQQSTAKNVSIIGIFLHFTRNYQWSSENICMKNCLAGSWYWGTGTPGCWFASHLVKKTQSNQQPTAENNPVIRTFLYFTRNYQWAWETICMKNLKFFCFSSTFLCVSDQFKCPHSTPFVCEHICMKNLNFFFFIYLSLCIWSVQMPSLNPLCLSVQLWTDFNSCLTSLGKVVDLSDGDDLRQLVAQPLRVQEVQILEGKVIPVKHDTWKKHK